MTGCMETIRRDLYLNKLISKKHNNGLIKVLTGVRCCGKSFLLSNLFKSHLRAEGVDNGHITELAFKSFENKKYHDPELCYSYLNDRISGEDMHYVLLDAVQLLGEFESVLNSIARKGNADVYVTGNNAKFLLKDIITEFRGRGNEVRMHPLSFFEFLSAYTGSK